MFLQAPTSDLSVDERETSDNDNVFGLNVVSVSIFQSARDNFLNSGSADDPIGVRVRSV